MTEEQAIEILKEIQETNRAWLIRTTEATCEKIYLRNIEAIETVLNILKDKDREIEKKDKQIDLMTEEIEYNGCIKRVWNCEEKSCKECIKQYFKEIAEEK